MTVLDRVTRFFAGGSAPQDQALRENYLLLNERLAELELALEDEGWIHLGDEPGEFERGALATITDTARLYYLKNPLIQRGVNVQKFYVWGQGMTVQAKNEDVNEIIQEFMDEYRNQVELTGHQARMMKEGELIIDGNLFFVLFTNPATGAVLIRSVPFSEMSDILRNPEDSKDPWLYKRDRQVYETDESGMPTLNTRSQVDYYPDWKYLPDSKPTTYDNKEVHWDSPVYHVRVGGFSNWRFGISEVYSALDWAKAYKVFLENWASIVKAYTRFAFTLSGMGTKAEIAAAKSKIGAVPGESIEESYARTPLTGSIALLKAGRDLQPVRTAGATVAAEDGRRLLLMVAAAVGLPETFFGDVSVGTLATAKSLDRPTELAFKDRQTLWADVHRNLFTYLLIAKTKSGDSRLKGITSLEVEEVDGRKYESLVWADSEDSSIDIDFPPLIERDVGTFVGSIVDAATLKGAAQAGTIEPKDLTRMLLVALGEENIDETLERMYPPEEEQVGGGQLPLNDEVTQALEEFREAMDLLVNRYANRHSS